MDNFWRKLSKPIIGLAPMDGVTDFPMRQVQCLVARLDSTRQAKPDVMYTEFISVEGFIRKQKVFERALYFTDNQRPIVTQVFGYTPEAFYEAVSQIAKMGFDGIDINMGCPAKSVLLRGGGGALIGNFELSSKIIESTLKAIEDSKTGIPLSIKTRIGQKEIITEEWISFLSEYPISEITIHGRLLKDGNSGPVNWEEIKVASKICKEKDVVCLGNGGIKSLKEAREKCKKYGPDGVLIGQAACGNPWVFTDTVPSQETILKTILDHAKLVSEFYDEKGFVTILKHFSWYPKGFDGTKKLKLELLKTKNLQDVKKVIGNFVFTQ